MRKEEKEKLQTVLLACKLLNNTVMSAFPSGKIGMQIIADLSDKFLSDIKADPPELSVVLVDEPPYVIESLKYIVGCVCESFHDTLFNNSPVSTADLWLNRYTNSRDYSESERARIRSGFIQYLTKVREWALSEPSILEKVLSELQNQVGDLRRATSQQDRLLQYQQRELRNLQIISKRQITRLVRR